MQRDAHRIAPPAVTEEGTTSPPNPLPKVGRIGGWASLITRIGADEADDEDLRRKKALLVLLAVLIAPVSVVWGILYLALGSAVGIAPLVYFAISVASLVVFARTKNFHSLLMVQLLDILVAPTAGGQMLVGGFLPSGAVGLWGILAPLGALVFLEVRRAVRWFVAFLVVFLLTGILGELLFADADLPTWFTSTMLALNVCGAGAIAFTLLAFFANQRNAALQALRAEQEKAEALLVNVLPSSIAERLKADGHRIADHFAEASILFADVVDFTPLAQRLSPAEMVGILDQLFSRFDELTELHGLEKIKTIGDCYMAVAGVPDPRPDHARKAALLALDMRAMLATSVVAGLPGLELRIGINSGPVVAGVIGRKRFLYDLWGDAVNIASRMESHGTPGEIQITRATFELVQDEFVCRQRGTIPVKGKGQMETWYLVGLRADPRSTESDISSTAPEASTHGHPPGGYGPTARGKVVRQDITTEASITIAAAPATVWKALTTPALIKRWFFGVDTETDWREGGPIVHRGEYEGMPYEDKGTIVNVEPERRLVHTHWSPVSGLPDREENYQEVTWSLAGRDGSTVLTVSETNLRSEEAKTTSEQAWNAALTALRELAESGV
jgi:guanylate cyclase